MNFRRHTAISGIADIHPEFPKLIFRPCNACLDFILCCRIWLSSSFWHYRFHRHSMFKGRAVTGKYIFFWIPGVPVVVLVVIYLFMH